LINLHHKIVAADSPVTGHAHRIARHIALLAVRSLYHELALYPKPGLVSFRDNGAHLDMDAAIFMRSLFSLRGYFVAIAAEGTHAARHERYQHAPGRDLHTGHTRCGRRLRRGTQQLSFG
jgi:hypothetical protein